MLSKVGCTGKGTYCIIQFCEIPTQRQWRMPGERGWEKREQRACLVSTRLYCGKLKMLSRWTPMGTVLWPMSVLNAEDITPWTLSWWRKRRGRATHTQIRDENGFFSPSIHNTYKEGNRPHSWTVVSIHFLEDCTMEGNHLTLTMRKLDRRVIRLLLQTSILCLGRSHALWSVWLTWETYNYL